MQPRNNRTGATEITRTGFSSTGTTTACGAQQDREATLAALRSLAFVTKFLTGVRLATTRVSASPEQSFTFAGSVGADSPAVAESETNKATMQRIATETKLVITVRFVNFIFRPLIDRTGWVTKSG